MVVPNEQLIIALKQHRHSLTKPRQVVFKALLDKEPQTMREIVESCEGQVNRASVYRTIALFERLGIVARLQIGWKYKLELAGAFHHHHHFTCLSCGRVVPFDEDPVVEERLKVLTTDSRFTMRTHQLEIQGLCEQCQSAQ